MSYRLSLSNICEELWRRAAVAIKTDDLKMFFVSFEIKLMLPTTYNVSIVGTNKIPIVKSIRGKII